MGRILAGQVARNSEAIRKRFPDSVCNTGIIQGRQDRTFRAKPKQKENAYQKAFAKTREGRRQKRYVKACEQREAREANKDKIAEVIGVLDFETDPFSNGNIPKAFAAGFKTATTYEHIWGEEAEVIKWAQDKVSRFSGYVYAHNGGKFDFPAYLLKRGSRQIRGNKALLINGRLVKLTFGRAEIRDSYAILPSPLSAYDKGEIDYRLFHAAKREKHKAHILEYLKRDCESLHALVLKFVVQNGLKVSTAAGAAMASLKALCQEVDSLTEQQDADFRKFYYGGRVQCFEKGVHFGRFSTFDIKSAYPHAMRANHSISNEFKFIANPKTVYDTDFVKCVGVARGCFPVRGKLSLSYPTGNGEFFVTGHEYNAAIQLRLFDGKVAWVERPTRVGHFREYVDFHYKSKEDAERDGDDALRLIFKILINSGYGKYAQDPRKWREYVFMSPEDVIPEDNPEGWEEETCDEDAGYAIWSRPSEATPTFYNVTTAASITGYVRARIMRSANATKAYYGDTDSLTIDTAHASRMETGDALGQWGLEDESDCVAIAGKKLYGRRLTPEFTDKLVKKWNAGREKIGQNPIKQPCKPPYSWHKDRLWKIASKGCRISIAELFKICEGKTVTYRSEAPSMTVKSDFKFIERRIRMTA